MRITKSRLLEIIREEVEFHEKNTFELNESELEELTDTEGKEILDAAEEEMEGKGEGEGEGEGNENSESNLEEADVEEDRLFGPKDGEGNRRIVAEPNGRDRLEIKIR